MGVLKTTVQHWIVASTICVHSNSLKPILTEENKLARLLMANHFWDPQDPSKYQDMHCIAAESPSATIQIFKSKYHLKVKGDGKLTYHLGADYFEDPDGTFVSQPKKYIDKLADTYKRPSMKIHLKAIKLLLTRMIIQS